MFLHISLHFLFLDFLEILSSDLCEDERKDERVEKQQKMERQKISETTKGIQRKKSDKETKTEMSETE